MAKILLIAPYPHHRAPSQRFRFEQYEDFLIQESFDLHFEPYFDENTWQVLYKEGNFLKKFDCIFSAYWKRIQLLFQLKKYDFIFIHREMAPLGPPFLEFVVAKLLHRKYIYDFDDAIWLPNYSEANSKFQWFKMYWKVKYCMKWAWKITAGNEYLANYARKFNANVQIIPTTIDTENYHNILSNHDVKKPIIGWTGTHSTMHYLDKIYPLIAELEKEFDFEFHVISDQAPSEKLKSLRYIPWNKSTEIADLAQLNIGLMPLEEDKWSEGKCGFKGLQYMALGIVAVMSPIGVNKTIVDDQKNGFLADTDEDWLRILRFLLTHQEKRKEIGKNGRKRVIEAYSVLSQKKSYLDLF